MGKQKAGAKGFRIAREPVNGEKTAEQTATQTAAPERLAGPFPETSPEEPPGSSPAGSAEPATAVSGTPSSFDDLGTLPEGYDTNLLFLVARDPELLFTYWDIAWDRHPEATGGQTHLRLYNREGEEVYRAGIASRNGHWYIPVGQGGATFHAEVGFFTAHNQWTLLARSNTASIPASGLSSEIDDCFATVPYHLAFQQALDLLGPSRQEGESFLDALHRVQREAVTLLDPRARWGERERALVAALLGHETAASLPTDDEALEILLREQLRERLDSAGIPVAEQEAWQSHAHGRSDVAASWFSGGRPGGESSWSAAVGAEKEREAFWSLFSAEEGGNSGSLAMGASEWLASPGLSSFRTAGASWSAAPSGARDFFFHLNAEVIYYGGTVPGSRIWIDGREIPLNADGTFRFHHRFPDGAGTLPILVQSPDGAETRSALLRLERRTDRHGVVTATPQPPGLEPPPGYSGNG